jgi:reactive intermediate/imine deaminase
MKKHIITSDQAPAAVGAYSQAVAAGPFVFISGQIPLNRQGEMVQGDIVVQTVQVIENLQAVLEAAGLSLKDVVKTTVFFGGYGRFCENERGLWRIFPGERAGQEHHSGGRPAPERGRGNRSRGPQEGLAGGNC